GTNRALRSFPTLRSSDLADFLGDVERGQAVLEGKLPAPGGVHRPVRGLPWQGQDQKPGHTHQPAGSVHANLLARGGVMRERVQRSEEHTSELQSLAYLVC